MTKNLNSKIILLAVICLTGFFGFVFEAKAYANVALGKGFYSSNPNPWSWQGLTDGQIVGDAYQEGLNESYTYATDSSSSFSKWVIITLGGVYNIDLIRLYKEFGPGPDGVCNDPLCAEGACGCSSCRDWHSNTKTIEVATRNNGGSWTEWGQYTFPSSSGGSHDWIQGNKIPATEVRITFLNTYGQWRTSYPCTCSNCGYYVFLREAQVYGDAYAPCSPPGECSPAIYRIDYGNTLTLNCWGTCRKLYNYNSGTAYMIPTGTSGEWTSAWTYYYNGGSNNRGITVSNCCP